MVPVKYGPCIVRSLYNTVSAYYGPCLVQSLYTVFSIVTVWLFQPFSLDYLCSQRVLGSQKNRVTRGNPRPNGGFHCELQVPPPVGQPFSRLAVQSVTHEIFTPNPIPVKRQNAHELNSKEPKNTLQREKREHYGNVPRKRVMLELQQGASLRDCQAR